MFAIYWRSNSSLALVKHTDEQWKRLLGCRCGLRSLCGHLNIFWCDWFNIEIERNSLSIATANGPPQEYALESSLTGSHLILNKKRTLFTDFHENSDMGH